MAWQGDQQKLQQLVQMFEAASSPNTQMQQQVMQALSTFSQMPDFNMYLVAVFVQVPNVAVDVRQRSGLLLKTNVGQMQRANIQPAMVEHINSQALVAMKDASKAIRHTAGTILTTVVKKIGFTLCNKTLEQLVESLANASQEALEGSLSAIGKICEDGVDLLEKVSKGASDPTAAQEAQLFVTWANQRVLPRMLECAGPASPVFVRQSALECLNFFALGGAFTDNKYGMQQHGPRYIEVLGTNANDTSAEVLAPVCKGFSCIIEDAWSCLTDQYYQVSLMACSAQEWIVENCQYEP
jgi:transportin-1